MKDAQTRGFLAVQEKTDALSAVLAHAPPSFRAYEKVGSVAVIRPDDVDGLKILEVMVKILFKGQIKEILVEYDTYPQAAFLLASNENEIRHPDAAISFADKGLALQPDNALLTSEKAMAFYSQGKSAEGLAIVQAWLAQNRISTDADRARLLRAEGWGLIETGKLDAAQASYEESLKLEPNHETALLELECIKSLRLRSGSCPPAGLLTGAQAKGDGPTPVPAH